MRKKNKKTQSSGFRTNSRRLDGHDREYNRNQYPDLLQFQPSSDLSAIPGSEHKIPGSNHLHHLNHLVNNHKEK